MAHIAVFNPPAAGHVVPSLGVIRELVRRGHRVSYPGTASYADRIESTGAEYINYRSSFDLAGPREPLRLRGNGFIEALSLILTETKTLYPQFRDRFAGDVPDLVLHDGPMAWWGRALAATWETPAIEMWPIFASNEHWSMNQKYTNYKPFHPKFLVFVASLVRFLHAEGIKGPVRDFTYGTRALLRLVFIPEFFHFASETFDDSYRFVGPCPGDHSDDSTWTRPPGATKVILLSLGTIYQDAAVFKLCLDALDDPSWHVVMIAGEKVDVGPLPGNVELHTSVPRLCDVLVHADLAVTHAGMGTTLEALLHAVPTLALPQMAEQDANADRISDLRLGVQLSRRDLTVARVREAVTSLMDDQAVRASLRHYHRELRGTGGPVVAADAIEQVLGG